MPRLRKRMRRWQGLSRGLRRPPLSHGLGSSSADEAHAHTLGPRGDRGRGRGHTRGAVDVAPPSPPLAHEPSRSSPPPVSHSLAHPTIRKTSQRAELRFDCISNSSILTAYLTVTLREEIPNHASPRSITPLSPPVSGFFYEVMALASSSPLP